MRLTEALHEIEAYIDPVDEDIVNALATVRAEIKQIHKDYGFEIRDPYGTIWEQATEMQKEIERKDAISRKIIHTAKITHGGLHYARMAEESLTKPEEDGE